MIKHHLRLSLRYLWNHKLTSAINLIGLTTGLCVFFFALKYVQFETSYDAYHEKSARIYRLVTDVETPTGIHYESSPAPMAPLMQEAYPEIEAYTRVMLDYMMVRKDMDHSGEEEVAYADPALFSIFTLPLIQGDPESALEGPLRIVLSESAAMKYFGTTDCLGKTLILDKEDMATVSGVMKDMPYNSHFRVDFFISMSTLLKVWNPGMAQNWNRYGFYTYLLMPEQTPGRELESKLPEFVMEHMNSDQVRYKLSIEPLETVYLHGKPRGHRAGSSISGSDRNVYIFSIVAVLVLGIAIFNFINLTMALSVYRTKEIGIRKVLGGSKFQLIIGFLTDALVLCLTAFVLAILCCIILQPLVNQISGKVIVLGIFERLDNVGILLLVALITALIAGIYPAFYRSGFQPVNSFKGRFSPNTGNASLRKGLVIAQFSISIILITATMVVYRQLNFMQNQELGFQKDHLLVVDYFFDTRITHNIESVKQQFQSIPGIDKISISSSIPGKDSHKQIVYIENTDYKMMETRANVYSIDHEFLSMWQIPVIAGRSFSSRLASDSTQAMIINETTAKNLGFSNPDNVIGQRFKHAGNEGWIVGVLKDFHFDSFREQVQPLILRMGLDSRFTFMTFNLSTSNMPATIRSIENKWKELIPDRPISYFFSDVAYNKMYQAEERFGQLFICLSIIAITLSCLGLFGLATITAFQRQKEIGIRRVVGASVGSVVTMLSRDFIYLVIVAIVLATPIAWYAMNRWLQGFAYRIDLQWWMFAGAGLAAIIVAMFTVAMQSVRAAMADPAKALQSE